MGFIDDELAQVSKFCKNVLPNCKLVSCVRSMVRVEITRCVPKRIIVCIQFPKDYPRTALLIELKSKTLAPKFLEKLQDICDKECKTILGKEQICHILKFIANFVEENPLCCCYDEISYLKKLLPEEGDLRVHGKKSSLCIKLSQGLYYFKVKIVVPDDYPISRVCLIDEDTNLPPVFTRFILGQAKELARRCVEPPLKRIPNKTSFTPSPSLKIVVSFLVKTVRAFPKEPCQLCKLICLPENPELAVLDPSSPLHVERLYCGHLFHLQCLTTYMSTPPFHGGKKCPDCGKQVYHEKWTIGEKLAEDRWAHRQARDRELAEVADFFQ